MRNGGRLSEHRFEHRNSYGLALDTVYIWRAKSYVGVNGNYIPPEFDSIPTMSDAGILCALVKS